MCLFLLDHISTGETEDDVKKAVEDGSNSTGPTDKTPTPDGNKLTGNPTTITGGKTTIKVRAFIFVFRYSKRRGLI